MRRRRRNSGAGVDLLEGVGGHADDVGQRVRDAGGRGVLAQVQVVLVVLIVSVARL